jgi:hypothetical protein
VLGVRSLCKVSGYGVRLFDFFDVLGGLDFVLGIRIYFLGVWTFCSVRICARCPDFVLSVRIWFKVSGFCFWCPDFV